jgi:type I restriction enzyme S subunit
MCDRDNQKRRLIDVVTLPKGQVDPQQEPYKSLTLVAPDHVESCTGRLLARKSAREQGASSGKYEVSSGDVVLSKIRPYLRKVVYADFEGTCSADMYPLRATKEIYPRYLLYVLLGENFSRFAESVSERTGIPKLNREELSQYSLILPPLNEQRRISEILDVINDQLKAAGRSLDKLAVGRQAAVYDVMRNALNELDRAQVSQVEGLIGKHKGAWEFCTLGMQLKSIQAGNSPNLQDRPAKDGEWGVLKVSSVGRAGFLENENKVVDDALLIDPSLEVRAGDLLMTRANTPELVGIACVIDRTRPGLMLCDKTLRLQLRPEAGSSRFVNELLALPQVRRQIEIAATGTSGSMKNISQGAIRQLVVPWATGEVQQNVVRLVEAYDRDMRSTAEEVVKLRRVKQALMDDLLTGRVRVSVEAVV